MTDTWTAEQRNRLAHERTLLQQYFPEVQWHHPTVPTKAYVEGPFRTNAGNTYRLRVLVGATFPNACPDMIVASPRPLRNSRGHALLTPSGEMHVLGGRDGATQICHYLPARWVPSNTLYLVLLKGRIWLEAYDAHLRTGHPLERYLRHMSTVPGRSAPGHNTSDAEELGFLARLRRLVET